MANAATATSMQAASNTNGLTTLTPWYSQPPAVLPKSSPKVSLINNRLTARPRRADWSTIVVVATVLNAAQPTPPIARRIRKTP